MNKSKLIAILLFLLLLLIILCTWNHSDDIAKQRNSRLKSNNLSTTINEVQKTSIDYYLKKNKDNYELTGNFSNKANIEKIHLALNTNTLTDTTNLNKTLEGNPEAIALTEKIIPLLTSHYVEGSIQYRNNKLTINGIVNSDKDRDDVNTLLANTTIANENNTKVIFIPTEPIHFKMTKENNSLSLEGLFQAQTEIESLTSRINRDNLQSKVHTDEKLISGKNIIHVSKTLVETLQEDYSSGFVAYTENRLRVEGTVESEEAKAKMEKLLQASGFTYTNNTNITLPQPSEEELAKAQLLKEQEAQALKLEEERVAAEKLAQAQEEANALKLAQEKATAEKLAQEQAAAKKIEEANAAKEALDIEAQIKHLIDLENINFAVNKAQLTEKSLTTIGHIANILQDHTSISVEIGGHTDSDGDANYNQTLSQKRVDTVKQKLIDLGINANRLMAVGYGESNPLVSNDTKENKRLNRRVEFKVKGE